MNKAILNSISPSNKFWIASVGPAIALVGWLAIGSSSNSPRQPAVLPQEPASQPPQASVARRLRDRDPRFVQVAPLRIPAASSPEAKRMLAALETAYRAAHGGHHERPAADAPQPAPKIETSVEALTASTRQTLATLPDGEYVRGPLSQVANPETPAPLLNVLYEDLKKRPDPIKLRTLFILATIPSHPLAATALTDLRSLLKLDLQQDWSRWEETISQQLAHDTRGARGETCRVH